ncbi:MAG: ABC transporter substrate-binding protein [Deltaproteobacteria bacterium]|nr:ABC transporter substrate-binding protein [Deltaproteobacteria bacterium]
MKSYVKAMGTLVCALLVMAATFTTARGVERVRFRLNWISAGEGDHAPFYVAKDLGYYEALGLDVTIEKGSGSGDAVKFVEVGKVDLAIADFPAIAVARARGADVRIVAAYHVNSPNTAWTRKDTGITTPKDLAGHTIGSPAGDAQRIAFPAFAKKVGLDPDSVKWVNIHPAAKIQSLASKTIDVTVHWFDQLHTYRKIIGKENLVYFRWADYGVNPYGMAIFTSERMLKEKPDVVKRFVDATLRAQRWTILNPRKAIQIQKKYVPEVVVEPVLGMLEVSIKYMFFGSTILRHGLGWIDRQRMDQSVNIMNTYFGLPRPLNAEELYTNDFVPHHTWPYPEEFTDPSTWPWPYRFGS